MIKIKIEGTGISPDHVARLLQDIILALHQMNDSGPRASPASVDIQFAAMCESGKADLYMNLEQDES